MRAQLIPIDGSTPIDIVKDLTVVGRKDECDFCLHHKSVSKVHCVIVKTDGLLLLRDLGSTNGTRVNGQRVRRAALLPEDQLAIAGFRFRVHFGPDERALAPRDRTQKLSAQEVADLVHKSEKRGREPASERRSHTPLQPKVLPDIYPEDAEPAE